MCENLAHMRAVYVCTTLQKEAIQESIWSYNEQMLDALNRSLEDGPNQLKSGLRLRSFLDERTKRVLMSPPDHVSTTEEEQDYIVRSIIKIMISIILYYVPRIYVVKYKGKRDALLCSVISTITEKKYYVQYAEEVKL